MIWPEHLGGKEFLDGVDLARLAADYQEITGRPLPVPAPPPPAPDLLKELAALIRKVTAAQQQEWAQVTQWLKSHGL